MITRETWTFRMKINNGNYLDKYKRLFSLLISLKYRILFKAKLTAFSGGVCNACRCNIHENQSIRAVKGSL